MLHQGLHNPPLPPPPTVTLLTPKSHHFLTRKPGDGLSEAARRCSKWWRCPPGSEARLRWDWAAPTHSPSSCRTSFSTRQASDARVTDGQSPGPLWTREPFPLQDAGFPSLKGGSSLGAREAAGATPAPALGNEAGKAAPGGCGILELCPWLAGQGCVCIPRPTLRSQTWGSRRHHAEPGSVLVLLLSDLETTQGLQGEQERPFRAGKPGRPLLRPWRDSHL